jgi:hypothetical protein
MQQNNRSRILAIGILLIVMLLFVMLIVNPYIAVFNASESYVKNQAFQLQRGNKILDKKEFYLEELDRLENTFSAEDIYLKSTKKALATAEIQQIIKRISSQSNAELVSSQPVSSDDTGINSVGLSVHVKADIFSLQKLLYSLEASSPNLFINELQIIRGSRAIFKFNNQESNSQSLNVNMKIFGYINNK